MSSFFAFSSKKKEIFCGQNVLEWRPHFILEKIAFFTLLKLLLLKKRREEIGVSYSMSNESFI